MAAKDLTGLQFGRLTVVSRCGTVRKRATWRCECSCGSIRILSSTALISGNTRSCGCLQKDRVVEIFTKHGLRKHELRATHKNMIDRCFNPLHESFKWYGGRGIGVAPSFISLEDFVNNVENEIGKRPDGKTLDRIDVNGDYAPGNIRWATKAEQSRNTRVNNNLEFQGMRMCVTDWASHTGINVSTIRGRIRLGWSVEKTLTEAVK